MMVPLQSLVKILESVLKPFNLDFANEVQENDVVLELVVDRIVSGVLSLRLSSGILILVSCIR